MQKGKRNDEREKLIASLSKSGFKKKSRKQLSRKFIFNLIISMTVIVKRLFDFLLSLLFLLVFSPIFIFTALAIVVENPGPVFYSQTRVGKYGRHFDFYKFRSMVVGADKMKDQLLNQNESSSGVIFKMKRDPRITKTGRFIRRFSIDELPQLLNVLKGDMSLVGPRPPLPREVAEYSLQDRSRLKTLPGITCIWQVSGRSDIPFDQQVVLDREYIRERKGIMYDIMLLFRTVWAVLSGNGAY